MLKKSLVVVVALLVTASLANAATVSLNGAGATISGLSVGQTVQILINTDSKLLGLDAQISVTGGGIITAAMNSTDGATYGWDESGFPIDPIGVGSASVEVGAANFNGAPATVPGAAGYVTVKYMGGTELVSMVNASTGQFGGTLLVDGTTTPAFDERVVTLTGVVPEPATLMLLGLGGLLLRKKK